MIEQPFGSIALGSSSGVGITDSVRFLPGSVTSVSGNGLTVLYGGTQDGVSYGIGCTAAGTCATPLTYSSRGHAGRGAGARDHAGHAVGPGGERGPRSTFAAAARSRGRASTAAAAAPTDALVTPFTVFAGATQPGATQPGATQPGATQPADAIYAVIPGETGATPLVTNTRALYSGAADATPALGSTITLTAGAGGLPAGTYTLLPAYDALLPGGYRIEVTGAPPRRT